MTSLHVICGLGPPQSKILATPMAVKRKPSPGYTQARSQEVAKGGGAFWEAENNSKRT